MTRYHIVLLLFIFFSSITKSQRYNITGSITSSKTHRGLRGATISISGSNVTANSDDEGKYLVSLKNPKTDGATTMFVSKSGFVTAERVIVITNPMLPQDFELDSVEPKSTKLKPNTQKQPTSDEISTISYFINQLSSSNKDARINACHVLGQLGPSSANAILKICHLVLDDSSSPVKVAGISALSYIGIKSNNVEEVFRISLRMTNSDVKAAAAEAIGRMKYSTTNIMNDLKLNIYDLDDNVSQKTLEAFLILNPIYKDDMAEYLKKGIHIKNKDVLNLSYDILMTVYPLPKQFEDEIYRMQQDSLYTGYPSDNLTLTYWAEWFSYKYSTRHPEFLLSWIQERKFNTSRIGKVLPEADTFFVKTIVQINNLADSDYELAVPTFVSGISKWGRRILPFLLNQYKTKVWVISPILQIDSSYLALLDSAALNSNNTQLSILLSVIANLPDLSKLKCINELYEVAFPDVYNMTKPEIQREAVHIILTKNFTENKIIEQLKKIVSWNICPVIEEVYSTHQNTPAIVTEIWDRECEGDFYSFCYPFDDSVIINYMNNNSNFIDTITAGYLRYNDSWRVAILGLLPEKTHDLKNLPDAILNELEVKLPAYYYLDDIINSLILYTHEKIMPIEQLKKASSILKNTLLKTSLPAATSKLSATIKRLDNAIEQGK